jgi:Domain of unknown function (DUF4157)
MKGAPSTYFPGKGECMRALPPKQARSSQQPSSRKAKPDASKPQAHQPPGRMEQLQRAVGNQAVLRLLSGQVLQAKLAINAPNDIYEQEADRVADQVSHMPEPEADAHPTSNASHVQGGHSGVPGLQRECACGGTCANCQAKKEATSAIKVLQTKPVSTANASPAAAAPVSVHQVVRSSGRPLDDATRRFIEPRFGRDFGSVRVHDDSQAAASAREIHARAYTVGHNVVFAANQFSPTTPEGRKLLAHELTHVTQQRAGQPATIQRDPDDPTVPAPQPGTSAPAPAFDPDANEAAARIQDPDLPKIDRSTQKPQENEDAAQKLVWAAFPDADALNAAFEKLSPEVQLQVDRYATLDVKAAIKAGKSPDLADVKTANRAQFLGRMRLYFNSWAEVLSHFSAIERVDKRIKNVEMFLHHDARVRFERAAAVLESKGHPMPPIGEGFSLRGFHRGDIQHPGMMIHAMGYAFDIAAFSNPRIKNVPDAPFQYPDLLAVQGKAGVGPERTRLNLDLRKPDKTLIASAESMIEVMGKRTASDLKLSAADDPEPLAKQFFQNFEQQFKQMQAGSLAFMKSMSQAHRDAILEIRKLYFVTLQALKNERSKKKPDLKIIAALEQDRKDLLSSLPELMSEWINAIDAEIKGVIAKNPGMEKLRSPSDISRDLKSKRGEAQKTRADQAQAQAASARAGATVQAASRQVEAAKQRLKEQAKAEARDRATPNPPGDWQAVRPSTQRLKARHEALETALQDAITNDQRAWDVAKDAAKRVDDLGAALAANAKATAKLEADLKESSKFKSWGYVDRLNALRRSLASPDLSTARGVAAFEGLTTGGLSELTGRGPVDNPPLLRLLEIGYFNPKANFDLAFFEEMAHSGFWPGASWYFGSVDSMHFEFIEGRHSILAPGKIKK